MITAKYASWKDGKPLCPQCKGTILALGFKETVEYRWDLAIEDFCIGDAGDVVESCREPLVYVSCPSCGIDLVITDKIKEYFEGKV